MIIRKVQYIFLLVVALAIGIITSWFGSSILGFLPLFTIVLLLARGGDLKVANVLLFAGLIVFATTAVLFHGVIRQQAISFTILCAATLCVARAIAFAAGETITPHARPLTAPGKSRQDASEIGTGVMIHEADREAAAFASSRAFWTDVTQVISLRVRQPDGNVRWSKIRSEPGGKSAVEVDELDTSGDRIAWSDSAPSEATEPVAAAKNIENLFGNGWAFDAEGRWIYLPMFAQTTLGVTPEQLNESIADGVSAWAKLLHPDERDEVTENWLRSLGTGDPFNAEFRIRRKTGFAWARSAARCVRDRSGNIVGWYGTSIDIDVQRKTMEVLNERERELLQLINMVPSNIWRLGPDGEPNFFNTRMVEYLGIDVVQIEKAGLSRLDAMINLAIHPDDQAFFEHVLKQSLLTGDGFESRYRLRRSDGTFRWMSSRAVAMRDRDGRITQWYGLCHDIDDQVHAEEALQRSEWHLQRLIGAFPVHVCSWTPDGRLSYINQRYLEDLGRPITTRDELAAAVLSRVHPDEVAQVAEHMQRGTRGGEPFSVRYRRLDRDGSYRWTDGRFEPLRARDGEISEWFGMTIDVDDEMKVQQSLRERERSLQRLVETLPALIYCSTPEGEPIYRSQRLREFLGFNIEDKDNIGPTRLEGTLAAIIHPDDLPAVRERYARSLSTGIPYVMKHRLRRFDGTYRWVETRSAAMLDEEGKIVQWNGVCLDIDDLIRAQEELGLAQRNLARASQAASMAELTASIAHEVGQPLAALLSSSDACQQWLSAEPPNLVRAQRALDRVIRSANTATAVVTRIRALFRHSNEAKSPTSLAVVVADARELMAEEAARLSVRVQASVSEHLPEAILDRIQIQQVLVNLVRNAMEAMDARQNDRFIEVTAEEAAGWLQVAIKDNGPGIQNPDRIFEPFFTTKGEGMGMGLAICRSIVEAHGGRLWAENDPERGATFFFTLPTVEVADAA